MKFLLDSSALFAHFFDEPGADEVSALFHDPTAEILLSVLSAPELFAALSVRGKGDRFDEVWRDYEQVVDDILPVDEAVALQAVALRRAASRRVPNGDALIAAAAVLTGAMLIHRDPHFLSIPPNLLQQRSLTQKNPVL